MKTIATFLLTAALCATVQGNYMPNMAGFQHERPLSSPWEGSKPPLMHNFRPDIPKGAKSEGTAVSLTKHKNMPILSERQRQEAAKEQLRKLYGSWTRNLPRPVNSRQQLVPSHPSKILEGQDHQRMVGVRG